MAVQLCGGQAACILCLAFGVVCNLLQTFPRPGLLAGPTMEAVRLLVGWPVSCLHP